jgi:Tfp pilus assembly PilM family ATPase
MLGISVIDDEVQAVELSRPFATLTLTAIGQWRQERSAPPEMFREQLAAFMEANDVRPEKAAVCLDTGNMLVLTIPARGTSGREELLQHMRWEITQLLPGNSPDDFVIDIHPLQQSGGAEWREVLGVAVRRTAVRAIRQSCADLGLSLSVVDADHFSAENLITAGAGSSADRCLALVGVKRHRVDVSILDHGRLVSYRAHPGGSPEETALAVQADIDASLRVQEIALYGPKCTPELEAAVGRTAGAPVILLNPFVAIAVAPGLKLADHFLGKPHRFAAAVGVALREE